MLGDPPWRRKPCKVDLSVSKAGIKGENPALLYALSRDTINNYDRYLHIYTDASKITCGHTVLLLHSVYRN